MWCVVCGVCVCACLCVCVVCTVSSRTCAGVAILCAVITGVFGVRVITALLTAKLRKYI